MPRKLRIPKDGQPLPAATRLRQLPDKVQEEIWGWANTVPDAEQIERIEDRWGIHLSSPSQLSRWRTWYFQQQRVRNLNDITEQFEEFYQKANPTASRDKIREMGIAFFMSEAAATGNRDAFKDFVNLDIKERSTKTKARQEDEKLAISKRKLELLEAKARQADQAREVINGPKTPEEKQAAIKAIFGM